MPRNRRGQSRTFSPYGENDWITQSIQKKLSEYEQANVPPAAPKKEAWWKTGLKQVVAPIAAQTIARAGAKQFEPKGGGGYPGIEGSIARTMKSRAKAIEDEANLKAEVREQKQQAYNQRNAQIINMLVNLKKMKAEMGQQANEDLWKKIEWEADKPLRELSIEERRAKIDELVASNRLTNVEIDILEKTGYMPGRRNVGGGGTGSRPEAVEALDKKIADLIGKVTSSSPSRNKFVALQGATSEKELEQIYKMYRSGISTKDIYGGTRDKFDAMYRYMKERFRKRGENVPYAEPAKKIPGAGDLPPEGDNITPTAQSIVDDYFGE